MKVRIFSGRTAAFFFCMFVLGFLIGYDIALLTSEPEVRVEAKVQGNGAAAPDKTGLTDDSPGDMMNRN